MNSFHVKIPYHRTIPPQTFNAHVADNKMNNPFEDAQIAARYEDWYSGFGLYADRLEKELLEHLLITLPSGQTILEVGCGTGRFTRWFAEQGLGTLGLDVSLPMLDEAQRLGGARFVRGDAAALPFDDSEFDLVALITALEFVEDPELVLAEAVRVARRGLLLGVLNQHSWLAVYRQASRSAVWRVARFFSVSDLEHLVSRAAGPRLQSVCWRTTLWPLPFLGHLPLPWGAFIGLAAGLTDVRENL
jgi:ubiquinone/menaquinone biosynthesis C-methylase UbiE